MEFLPADDLYTDELRLVLDHTSPGDAIRGWVPTYYFHICAPDGTVMGSCDLRLGHNRNTWYGGNIGYRIEEPYRGCHYAAKACRLLFTLARRHGMDFLIITCNPDNCPSRRTCELLGGRLLETAALPEDNDMRREDGELEKCIFHFSL